MSGLRLKRKYFTDQGNWRGAGRRARLKLAGGRQLEQGGPPGRGPGFGEGGCLKGTMDFGWQASVWGMEKDM